jgi:hypothetical protein
MGHAAVLSLEDLREVKSRAEYRQQLHDRFDQWVERVEEEMQEPKPTLAQVTGMVFHLWQELTQSVIEGLLESRYAAEQEGETICCPSCGQQLRARGKVERTGETRVGAITVHRPYFYCVQCQRGSSPLDEALELAERRKQPDVQQAAAQWTIAVPYETACEVFQDLTGLSLRAHTAHEIPKEMGPSREAVEAKIAQVTAGKQWRPILVLAIAGADVPIRPETAQGKRRGRKRGRAKRARWQGQWREVTGFRFSLVDEDQIIPLLSWHQIPDEEELFAALKPVQEAGLIPEEQVRLCVLADGARWIWKRITALFPTAKEILDYYHCSEHIHRMAPAQYGDQPPRALEWVEATRVKLFWNEITGIIWGLQRMKPRHEEAAMQIEKGLGSLEQHKERLDYGTLRKGVIP